MHYPVLINAGNRETFDALNQLCEAIRAEADVKMSQRQLDGILLDISYFREDYEGSLKIIDRGLIPDDPSKKDMLITKVNAHIALKKGDYKTAIDCFRKFMAVIAKDNADTVDPIDQVRVSPEMILGLNARRIGDLWGKAGDPVEAAKAYAEARQYYSEALKKFPDVASGENKKIMREMKDIPQG
jgi:tetratricopeptide (TPR) repeat protein